VQVVRPTSARFDDTLALLQAADVAVHGDSDWTEGELRAEWDRLDLERDAWLVLLDGRPAGVAHLLERRDGRFIGDAVRSGFRMVTHVSERDPPPRWPAGLELRPLDIDAENPTGAVRLYERAGMLVLWRADVWERELDAGA
jgi:hypothetical protein